MPHFFQKLRFLPRLLVAIIIVLISAGFRAAHPPADVVYSSECSCENEGGVVRWRAKTDPTEPPRNAKDIHPITPSEMFAWAGPGILPRGGGRVMNELQWYALTGRVVAVQAENDGDVHMVLVDAQGERPGKVIAEIPLGMRWCAARTLAFSWTNAVFPFVADFQQSPFRLLHRHVVTLIGRAFYDTDHSGKNRKINRRPRDKEKAVWEIHPVMSLQVVEPVAPSPSPDASAVSTPPPAAPTSPPPNATEQFVTLIRPVTVKVPYGTVVIPAGKKLSFVSEDETTVRVRYLGTVYSVPSTAVESE